MQQLVFPILLFALMWFFLIRPQRQRVAAHQAFVASLAPGDRVVTSGGIVGTIAAIDGEFVRLDTGGGMVLELLRPAVARRLDAPSEG